MKKTRHGSITTPARPVYGLTPVGLQEYRAFQRDLGMYLGLGIDGYDFKLGRQWAEAAEKAYARDPENFILSGVADGLTRDEAVLRLIQYLYEPYDDD